MASGKQFTGLIPPKSSQPRSAFFTGKAGFKNVSQMCRLDRFVPQLTDHQLLRDNFTLSTWLCLGAVGQAVLVLAAGRVGLIPALAVLLYRCFIAYAMSVGWVHNTYMDGVLMSKFSAQFPDETGNYGSKPADSGMVVFLIGTRINHPMGLFAPGAKELGDYFQGMTKSLEEHAEQYGFLGMTSWLNSNTREASNELMQVGYFRNIEGLHAFAHSEHHREGWMWFNKHVKQYPHLAIFHETYEVPKGKWESIYVNSHLSGINSTTHKYTDESTGQPMWASPVVDASKGLLKTSAGRMSKSKADEHDQYGVDPYQ